MKANAALQAAAGTVPGTLMVDMQARYPGGAIDMLTDGEAEAFALLEADRIVLQFPIQWYATPALLKAWQDSVLTRMYYFFADTEDDELSGTPVMVAATAGNTQAAYSRGGANHFTLDELLAPLRATALRCGLPWHSPHLVFRADKLEPAGLGAAGASYVSALEAFIAATPSRNRSVARAMGQATFDTPADPRRGTPGPSTIVAFRLPALRARQLVSIGLSVRPAARRSPCDAPVANMVDQGAQLGSHVPALRII